MLFSVLIGLLIFSYAGWTIIGYARKTKQGKCAACSLNKSCSSACDDLSSASEFVVKKTQ